MNTSLRKVFPLYTRKLAAPLGVFVLLYLGFILVFGPPYLARKHALTWSLNFKENVIQLTSSMETEEEFIDSLRWRGFEMLIRPENPINGSSTRLIDLDGEYTTYEDYLRSHGSFQSAFPSDTKPYPRIAVKSFGFIICSIDYGISWHLVDNEIVNVSASRSENCV